MTVFVSKRQVLYHGDFSGTTGVKLRCMKSPLLTGLVLTFELLASIIRYVDFSTHSKGHVELVLNWYYSLRNGLISTLAS